MVKKRISRAEKQRIARDHIAHLTVEAEKIFGSDPALAHSYAKDIRRSAMRVNLPLPRDIRRRICRKCDHFLVPGVNCRVRTANHHIVSKCLDCGSISRFGYIREQKERRKKGKEI